jgi:hypothetical protein
LCIKDVNSVLKTLLVTAGLLAGAAQANASTFPALTGELAPPPAIASLHLPDGRLQPVAIGKTSSLFVAVDQVKKTGEQTLEAVLYQVFEPGLEARGLRAVQIVSRQRVDCQHWTHEDLGAQAFTDKGELALWTSPDPAETIKDSSTDDLVAGFLCGLQRVPVTPVSGHAAALELGRELIQQKTRTPS